MYHRQQSKSTEEWITATAFERSDVLIAALQRFGCWELLVPSRCGRRWRQKRGGRVWHERWAGFWFIQWVC
jgi:hypothetical protein